MVEHKTTIKRVCVWSSCSPWIVIAEKLGKNRQHRLKRALLILNEFIKSNPTIRTESLEYRKTEARLPLIHDRDPPPLTLVRETFVTNDFVTTEAKVIRPSENQSTNNRKKMRKQSFTHQSKGNGSRESTTYFSPYLSHSAVRYVSARNGRERRMEKSVNRVVRNGGQYCRSLSIEWT